MFRNLVMLVRGNHLISKITLFSTVFFMFKISFCACNRLEYMFVFCFSKRKRNRKEKHNKTKKVLRGGLPILMDVGMNERGC